MRSAKVLAGFCVPFLWILACFMLRSNAALALPDYGIQQILISDVISALKAPPDPATFWDDARNLGDKVMTYTNALLDNVDPSVRDSVDTLKENIKSTLVDPGLQTFRAELESLNNLNLTSLSSTRSPRLK